TYQPGTVSGIGHVHFAPGQFGVSPVLTQNALLAETGLRFHERQAFFARFEFVEKDELYPASDPRHGLVYNVSKLGAGYVFDFLRAGPLVAGAGAFGSLNFVARELESLYGELPKSYGFYVRVALR
ncbi:MAG TPA: hypothetical protein VIE88_03560, partial [Vicinamibacteria bacterium]